MCYQTLEIKNPYPTGSRWEERYMTVPCKQCLECRQKRANEVALRSMFEMKDHQEGCFITLTYETSPVVLIRRHYQLFLKRLRKAVSPVKIRTLVCGEYGDKNYRPHFHMLIYGYDFPDKYRIEDSSSGKSQYMSNTLDDLWYNEEEGTGGRCTIQDLTLNSSAYCALYSAKPKFELPKHLQENPEFNQWSRGLGVNQLLKGMETYMQTDEIWFDGKKHNIPQIILNKYFNGEPQAHQEYYDLKQKRLKKAKQANRSYELQYSVFTEHGRHFDHVRAVADKKYRKENAIKRLTKNI